MYRSINHDCPFNDINVIKRVSCDEECRHMIINLDVMLKND